MFNTLSGCGALASSCVEPKSGGDRRHQWIDRDEKLHRLHLKSDGQETPDEDRIRAFFGRKRGNTQECENASQFWGKQNGNPTSILFLIGWSANSR